MLEIRFWRWFYEEPYWRSHSGDGFMKNHAGDQILEIVLCRIMLEIKF
jgi:hypothetical protein